MIEAPIEPEIGAGQVRPRFYQPELDGLRFYAFLSVFICHAMPFNDRFYQRLHLPLPWLWASAVRAGGSGVDLFFALSAFLITSLLLRERHKNGEISLGFFYVRRILRIWPLYFLVLLIGLLFAHTGGDQESRWFFYQRLPWYYVVGYLFFVSNWVYAVFGAPQSVCAPLWTVSIEEQFYLIWPALMARLNRRGMAITAISTFLISAATQAAVAHLGLNATYIEFGSASRVNSLALGILIALLADRVPEQPARGTRLLLVLGGLAAWVASNAWLSEQYNVSDMRLVWVRLIISISSAAILYGCLHSRTRLLTGRFVVGLGKVSYGLYAFHFTGILLVLTLCHPISASQKLAAKALSLLVTVVLAVASYRWIESPFLRLKDRFATVLSRPV